MRSLLSLSHATWKRIMRRRTVPPRLGSKPHLSILRIHQSREPQVLWALWDEDFPSHRRCIGGTRTANWPSHFLTDSGIPRIAIFGSESAPRWRSYRLYAGVALALVVLILGYMAWRSAQTTSGASHLAPQAPAAVTNPVASTPRPSNPNPDTSSQIPSAANGAKDSTSTPTATGPAAAPAKATPPRAIPRVPASTPSENGAETPPACGGGSEELAMARDYLNGADGKEQSPTQAVPWLWKAVAKRNAVATVLLAGMYLRGDGVPRNCDAGPPLARCSGSQGKEGCRGATAEFASFRLSVARPENYWVRKTDSVRRDSYHNASSTRFQRPSLS